MTGLGLGNRVCKGENGAAAIQSLSPDRMFVLQQSIWQRRAMRSSLAFAIGFSCAVAVPFVAQAQTPLAGNEPLVELRNVHMSMLRAAEENTEILRSFQFNLTLAAICINDINDIYDQLEEQMNRIEKLSDLWDKEESGKEMLSALIKTEAAVAIAGMPSKMKRITLNIRVCGSVPIITARANLAISMLNDAEHALSRLQ